MKLKDFLKDKAMLLTLHLVCMGAMAGFLRATGYETSNILLILIFWCLILLVWLSVTYWQRSRYFQKVGQMLGSMDQRYLLGELLPDSFRLEDRLYRQMIRSSNKSVIERIHQIEEEQKEYREYIESWVHEVKTPITGISLICGNRRDKGEDFRTISLENQKIENYVEMVLYYARMEAVYKDYLIRETNLGEVVYEVLGKNRMLLIQNQVQAEVDCDEMVYTDRKWLAFILNQMILNSTKYRSEKPMFHIYAKRRKNSVILVLEDNGIGIPAEELTRIFEKGFTGSNGREREKSTGMGLYLCRKLCDKMEIGLWAASQYKKGTSMFLEFPISNYLARGI